MKVWITKYALTIGIIEIDDSDFQRTYVKPNGMICFYDEFGDVVCSYKRSEHFGLKELAIQKAEEMRQKKIASLKNQIEKLEGMRFE